MNPHVSLSSAKSFKAPIGTGTHHGTSQCVSQAVLERLQALKDDKQRLETEYNALRDQVVASLSAGAGVQAGRLKAHVRRSMQRRLTATNLTPVLGQAKVEQLQQLVEPNECVQLFVDVVRK
ncbi:MAG: hypothetical protein FJ271_30370 [Planctomycetes bacterium]|nr:hypothetical protein [Planctomycetota bacterium]